MRVKIWIAYLIMLILSSSSVNGINKIYYYGFGLNDEFHYQLNSVSCETDECRGLDDLGLPIDQLDPRYVDELHLLKAGDILTLTITEIPEFFVWSTDNGIPYPPSYPKGLFKTPDFEITQSIRLDANIVFVKFVGVDYGLLGHEFDDDGVLVSYKGPAYLPGLPSDGISTIPLVEIQVELVRISPIVAYLHNNPVVWKLPLVLSVLLTIFILIYYRYRKRNTKSAQYAETWPKN